MQQNVNKIQHRYYRINSVIAYNFTSDETWLKSWICAVLHFTVFRAQASKAQGPIVFQRIIFFFLYIFFFNLPGTFGGLNVLKNS